MGIRGCCQVRQPEYGDCCLTSWAQGCAYDWLTNVAGLEIYTRNQDGDCADTWEIGIPDDDRMRLIISHLRRRPKCLGEDGEDSDWPESLADLLEEGWEAAKKNNYGYIIIDWF